MSLSHEHVGSKIPAKINTFMLTRAELLIHLCYEIPCIRIRKCLKKMWDHKEATLSKALKNEKECQDRPKMTVEYQQDFSEETAQDALLDKKTVTSHVFLDFRGNIEKMETSLPNGTVAKITTEKKSLIENDGIDRHSGTSLKVMETRL